MYKLVCLSTEDPEQGPVVQLTYPKQPNRMEWGCAWVTHPVDKQEWLSQAGSASCLCGSAVSRASAPATVAERGQLSYLTNTALTCPYLP